MQSIHHIKAATALTLLAASIGSAQAQHGHLEFCAPDSKATPVLSKGDFDGDGTVTRKDIQLLAEQIGKQQYIAFFDRNADHVLDQKDVAIATAEAGAASTQLDRELAAAYHGTKAYRQLSKATADGFVPWTEALYGHGAHYVQRPERGTLDYTFNPAAPEGLNYDADGRLWAVFYYIGPSPTRLDGTKYPPGDRFKPFSQAPEGFCGDADVWHHHAGGCFKGLNYEQPVMDPARLSFREGLSPQQCLPGSAVKNGLPVSSNAKWTPEFHMLHAWIYELNPCGTFAGTHPDLAKNALHPSGIAPNGHIHASNTHPSYPFTGGTLCAWLGQLGQVPEFCTARK
ncbi:hypothetical protein KY495_04255 [Massilia sp. PAMC28688]|uniref:hypothetical protein n=1 Tax=Massilia sp. PAMC28688 TaxID=2861283 RepID=UPI001C62E663|nr:hypothetical protein [Massilia sp. PAMC28688]QYF94437.1 hypothetical protein KY495_04255 [Massilia sp. PAMC28688]